MPFYSGLSFFLSLCLLATCRIVPIDQLQEFGGIGVVEVISETLFSTKGFEWVGQSRFDKGDGSVNLRLECTAQFC